MEKRCSFELFKSNVCHWLKEEGDIDFLIQVLESDLIRKYYNRKWYLESFYLLGMFDYICRINDAPICSEYDDLRRQRMQEIIYQSRQSTTSIGVTHRMGVGECLFVTYWLLMYSCISCKLFSFAIVVK